MPHIESGVPSKPIHFDLANGNTKRKEDLEQGGASTKDQLPDKVFVVSRDTNLYSAYRNSIRRHYTKD